MTKDKQSMEVSRIITEIKIRRTLLNSWRAKDVRFRGLIGVPIFYFNEPSSLWEGFEE